MLSDMASFRKALNTFIYKTFIYVLLCGVAFVFLYPILYMLSSSLKDAYDIVNPMILWIPSKLYFKNYVEAFKVIGGFKVYYETIMYIGLIAIVQTISSAIIAYGIAKYDFWGKKVVFAVIIATFILPPQITFLPQFVMYNSYNLLNSILPVLLPTAFGQGIKNAIFILIFYQYFRMSPKSLDEASSIDGAGHFKIFLSINMKMAVPAIVIVFIFSLVWNWNETYLAEAYFGNILTLPIALNKFVENFAKMFPNAAIGTNPLEKLNEGIILAGTLLSILPLIIGYVFVEKQLIESFDKAGITGE
jgi:multiple sugar transport system permease protein